MYFPINGAVYRDQNRTIPFLLLVLKKSMVEVAYRQGSSDQGESAENQGIRCT